LAFIAVAIVLRLAAGALDRDRIARYIAERGGRVISISWAPFGRGWFGEQNARIYEVVYYDREGKQHLATCKTSMWSGVYWTEDRVTHSKAGWFAGLPRENRPGQPLIRAIPETGPEDASRENDRLKEENIRLKEELKRLKGES
jgi:hypothetical protein